MRRLPTAPNYRRMLREASRNPAPAPPTPGASPSRTAHARTRDHPSSIARPPHSEPERRRLWTAQLSLRAEHAYPRSPQAPPPSRLRVRSGPKRSVSRPEEFCLIGPKRSVAGPKRPTGSKKVCLIVHLRTAQPQLPQNPVLFLSPTPSPTIYLPIPHSRRVPKVPQASCL